MFGKDSVQFIATQLQAVRDLTPNHPADNRPPVGGDATAWKAAREKEVEQAKEAVEQLEAMWPQLERVSASCGDFWIAVTFLRARALEAADKLNEAKDA